MAKPKRHNGYLMKTFTFDGKRYYVYGRDQRELDDKVIQKKQELENQQESYEDPTLDGYYEYFTEIRRSEIRESTLRGQKYQFRNISEVVLPSGKQFGKMKIREITRRDIELARQTLLEKGKTPQYLNICFGHLNHVFASAVLDDTIPKNPCKALKQLKREGKPISETKHRALSEEETVRFLRAAEERGSVYLNCFKLMLLTGLRVGELGALYLTDIDDETIHVRRSITRDEVGQYLVGENAKTQSGIREIPLTPQLKRIIMDQRELNNKLFGFGWSGLTFQSAEGEILREYTVNREIKRICLEAEIEYFTCHALRITFATRFIEQRPQDYKILSDIMGHKDISITLNLYTRVMKENKIAAMNGVNIKMSEG